MMIRLIIRSMPRSMPRSCLFALTCVVTLLPAAMAQTFQGSLTGVITDKQGAVVPNAAVRLTNPATGVYQDAKSNGVGVYIFPALAPATYTVTVTAPGFETRVIKNIQVAVSKVVDVPVALSVGSQTTVVEVEADAVSIDTTASDLVENIAPKEIVDMPMNGRDFTQMLKFTPGDNLSGSVNGQRSTSVNFQIDGTANTEPLLGIVSSNQAGVAGVAGSLVPIDAIDQFSMQSDAEADMGRNAGANQNMVLKSGTNEIHGDVYYFNRNEFFAAISPVAPVGSPKVPIRNNQPGFTLGGPIWKDHTFLFLSGEEQLEEAGNSDVDTVLNNAWIAAGTNFLKSYGLSANALSLALYKTVFPAVANNTGAVVDNWFANAPDHYVSYNAVIKLDHNFNAREKLSVTYLGATGHQSAPVGSYYPEYFQEAPQHVFNMSVIQTSVLSSNLLSQLHAGVNYYGQSYRDVDEDYYPGTADELNLGLSGQNAASAPNININGFDFTDPTPPSARWSATGQIGETLRWTVGRHSFNFGGSYQRDDVFVNLPSNSTGSFTFDGTRGPWANDTATDNANCEAAFGTACTSNDLALADYLNGQPSNQTLPNFLSGNDGRVYLMNSADIWAQDDFKASQRLTLNLGIRYTLPGAVYDAKNDLYSFVPGKGFVLPLYPYYHAAFAPRLGFAYSPFSSNTTAIRGTFGIFYDVPGMQDLVSSPTGNGGAAWVQNNPAGPDPAYTVDVSNMTWQQNVNPFTGGAPPQLGAMGVNPNYRIPYAMNFSLGVEQQLGSTTMLKLSYVGAQDRRLDVVYDLNQPIGYNFTTGNYIRPYDSQLTFPGQTVFTGQPLLGINQVASGANSNYNSLQAVLHKTLAHGFSGTANYTWAHSLDDASSPSTPMNSYDLKQDYGPSSFDIRQTLTGFVSYMTPKFTMGSHLLTNLTNGYQFNSLFDFNSGTPLNVLIGKDYSYTDEGHDRVSIVPGVNRYLGNTVLSSSSGRSYSYLNKSAYSYPIPGVSTPTVFGVYGNEQRDGGGFGPKFGDVDFSIFKMTPITERVNSQFRIEIFNLFNQHNFANPKVSNIGSGTFGEITNTKNGSSAPGIGYGEPFNIQFGLKLMF